MYELKISRGAALKLAFAELEAELHRVQVENELLRKQLADDVKHIAAQDKIILAARAWLEADSVPVPEGWINFPATNAREAFRASLKEGDKG